MQRLPQRRVEERNDVARPVRLMWITTLLGSNVGAENSEFENNHPQVTQIAETRKDRSRSATQEQLDSRSCFAALPLSVPAPAHVISCLRNLGIVRFVS